LETGLTKQTARKAEGLAGARVFNQAKADRSKDNRKGRKPITGRIGTKVSPERGLNLNWWFGRQMETKE
jgi:hypothetical protein